MVWFVNTKHEVCETKWRPVLKYNFLDSYLFCFVFKIFAVLYLRIRLFVLLTVGKGGMVLVCTRRFRFMNFTFFPHLFIYLFSFYFSFTFFLPTTFTHTHNHTHDPRPLPTAFSYTRPVPVRRPFKFKYCHASRRGGRLGKVRLRPRRPHVSGCFWIRKFFFYQKVLNKYWW